MRFTSTLLPCLAALAFSAGALAQDSVSKVHSPVTGGDAVDARAAGEQQNDYVVDQTILHGSWGTVFGVAPLVKASLQRTATPVPPTNYSGFLIAQHLSRDLINVSSFARPSYGFWNATGFGVNDDPARNDPPATISSSGLAGHQFGAGFAEGATGAGTPAASLHRITGAVVDFTDARPSRLYVARVCAAVDNLADDCDFGSIHMGSIDADGYIYFRGDNNSPASGLCPMPYTGTTITANNIYRVSLLARTPGTVNLISSTGPSDGASSAHLINASATTQNCPNNLPNSIAGVPMLAGADFNNSYVYGSTVAPPPTVTTTQRAPTALQTRGSQGLSPVTFSFLGATSVATLGIVAKDTAVSAEAAPLINLWGIDVTGAPTGTLALELPPEAAIPGVITDPDQPAWSSGNVAGPSEFDHYHSQTAFQGGNAQVAIGQDQSGNLLAAAVVYYGLTYSVPPAISSHLTDRNTYIAVARVDPTGATTSWSTAGWTQETTTPVFSDGKIIYQNGVTPIGRLTGANFGPSISAPMIDSVGNVWFVASIELSGPPVVQSTGLLRAVYDEPSFSYRLELVAKVGDIFQGRNSATPYQIRFLDVKDSDSVSSSGAWSGNVSPWAFKGQSTVGMLTSDSATLGGLVLHAGIIYDVDGNGLYEVGSGATPPVPGSPDEDYEVLLYISSSIDINGNDIPDDGEQPGTEFCSNSTLSPALGFDHVTPCPCGNVGAPANGCAHSFSVLGAHITALGVVATDTVQLKTSNTPAASFTLFMQHNALADGVFHDGVLCAGGTLIRLRGRNAVAGEASFPNPLFDSSITLSQRGSVTIGSGAVRYYAGWYRNASTTFCPPATANVTNGYTIVW